MSDYGIEDQYRDHIRRLREAYSEAASATGYDAIVIAAGHAAQKSPFDDQDWPFVATPMFAHWVPGPVPGGVLVVADGAVRVVWPTHADFWDSPPVAVPEYVWSELEPCEVATAEAIAGFLPTRGRIAFIGDGELSVAGADVNPPVLLARLELLRAHKSAYERDAIAAANRRAAAGHLRVREAFLGGDCSELELHLLYLAVTGQDDADTPYKNIFALGKNAAVLHHVAYGRAPIIGDASLLVDAGATCRGYASDITRTHVRGKSAPATTFAALIAQVEALQQALCARMVTGTDYQSLHDDAHAALARAIVEVGLARASVDELVASGATRKLFPHGLGHSLGLQVHDVGCRLTPPRDDNPFLRMTATLADGHVVTVEPGCYFIPALLDELRGEPVASAFDWKLIAALAPFGGIRIEDNVAVTDGDPINLTRQAFSASA